MSESGPNKPVIQKPTRFRSDTSKESFLRRMRRQRLKYITILPSLVTIINGACGFAAITFASQAITSETGQWSYHRLVVPYFAMAGYMILLAMVADMLDGRLARMSNSTSSFGGQLDSLCDIVSFGVAPAFLMIKIIEHKLSGLTEINPIVISFLERFIWLAAATYLSCAAIRLARFNVENEEDESAHMSFVGLPSPAAAGIIVSLVIFNQETVPDFLSHPGRDWAAGFVSFMLDDLVIYSLPIITLCAAFLMVSRIRYAHVLNQYIRGKKPFAHLIRALLFFALIIWSRQVALVVIFCGFAASGFLKWFYCRFFRRGRQVLDESAVSALD
ncbi:MAG: phosphatidylcholine/phosphatidylserine synthase [Sedimentisphaerales bacterium]|jgi:CDP-diacylglycerol--serine O-phosphatidyltransferase